MGFNIGFGSILAAILVAGAGAPERRSFAKETRGLCYKTLRICSVRQMCLILSTINKLTFITNALAYYIIRTLRIRDVVYYRPQELIGEATC